MELHNDTLLVSIYRNDELYDILSECPTDEDRKELISEAIKLHQSCFGDGRIIFHPTPKKFGFELIRTSEEFLKNLRRTYEEELLKEISELDINYLLYKQHNEPLNINEIRVAADGHLSRAALYYLYIKEIDKRLSMSNDINNKK